MDFDDHADVQPFTFKIPDLGSESWKEQCYGCGLLFRENELDQDGYCEECAREEEQEKADA